MLTVAGEGSEAVRRDILLRLGGSYEKLLARAAREGQRSRCGLIVLTGPRRGGRELRCGTLLMRADTAADGIRADCALSYGMSPRATLTLSSIGEDECVLAIQRALVTIWGDPVVRQELPVPRRGRAPEQVLAVEGALILLGEGALKV